MTAQQRSDLECKLATVEALLVQCEVQAPRRDAVITALEAMREETKHKLAR